MDQSEIVDEADWPALSLLADNPAETIHDILRAGDSTFDAMTTLAAARDEDIEIDFFWEVDLEKVGDGSRNGMQSFIDRLARLLTRLGEGGTISTIVTLDDGTLLTLGELLSQWQARRGSGPKHFFITGQVPAGKGAASPEELRQPFAASEAAQRDQSLIGSIFKFEMAAFAWPQLDDSVAEIQAAPADLPDTGERLDGSGSIVGVVDFGCDFTHPNFRTADGDTRILYLWDQNDGPAPGVAIGPASLPSVFSYGREFDAAQIDSALAYGGKAFRPDYVDPEDVAFWALGYDPHDNYYAEEMIGGAHGTHVLDIAAGNGRATLLNHPMGVGVAPGADIIFVQARKPASIGGRRLMSLAQVLRAVQFIFIRAAELGKPAVVNISLNSMSGPHDGTAIVDRMLDALLKKNRRAVVIAAGNFGETRQHVEDRVRRNGQLDLSWHFDPSDPSRNDVEIWYDGEALLTLLLTGPKHLGNRPRKVEPQQRIVLTHRGQIIGLARNDARSGPGRRNHIFISLQPSAPGCEPAGEEWGIKLYLAANQPGAVVPPLYVPVNAWIDRDDQGQSSFAPHQATERGTLGSISCANGPIVVGAYYVSAPGKPLLRSTSQGPTRDGRTKPEVSAPGRSIRAALSKGFRQRYPDNPKWRIPGTVTKDGTSMAAPHVAGIVALMFEWRPDASNDAIRDALIQSARSSPFDPPPSHQGGWDPGYGAGRVSAAGAIQALP